MTTTSVKRVAVMAGVLLLLGSLSPDPAFGQASRGLERTDGQRVALVIGNSQYQNASPLTNPRNDATAVGEALQRLGFDVDVQLDLTKDGMDQALRRFGDRLEGGARVALFFYAGHAFQVNGENYLAPVDTRLVKPQALNYEVVTLKTVLQEMEAGQRTSLVFLDACRNNPWAQNLARSSGSGNRSVTGQGLAAVGGVTGTLIGYATRDGMVAADGTGKHSPYTQALLNDLETPGLEVGLLLRKVREKVLKETNDQQVPWEYGSLIGEFYFKPLPIKPPPEGSGGTGYGAVDPQAVELAYWDSIKNSDDAKLFRSYLERYPRGQFVEIAKSRLEKFERRRPGETFRDRLQDGTEGPEMVVIGAGASRGFWMGSPESEKDRDSDEQRHRVSIPRDYALGRYEVTFAEYDRYCAATGRAKPHDGGRSLRGKEQNWGRGDRPVINVSWDEAVGYAEWLSRETGKRYRLPTEAEWEYGARGGTETAYWWGNEVGRNQANCDGCGSQWDNKQTAPVGSFAANGFGLYDMAGNVREWTCSAYDEKYGGGEQVCAGKNDASAPRVIRGGSWSDDPRSVRSASRNWGAPAYRGGALGFRLARDL